MFSRVKKSFMQGKTINGFELKRPLGVGGMAEVWYAENEIRKPAAVKILNAKLAVDSAIVERFRTEAEIMVRLNHPYIRQVYGYGTIDERPAIIMEYLDGDDLKARMKQDQRFSESDLEKWWNQLTEALNYTHAQGIVHRDIKPGNIFVDNYGNIKLLDFGIAKVRESISSTQTGQKLGTLMYMSPEQVVDSKHVDYRTDLYSLAVTFVHLLTGKKPYDSDSSSDFQISEQIVYKPLDLSGLPSAWRAFLTPYLEKDPMKRPALRPFSTKSLMNDGDDTQYESGYEMPPQRETPPIENRQYETVPSSPKPNGNKGKTWLWIVLAALLVGLVSFILVNNKKKNDRQREETNARLMEENCYNSCSSIADYQEYLSRYPDGRFVVQASEKIEKMNKEMLDAKIHSFLLDYTRLTETSDENLINSLVYELYAPSVERYFSANNVDRNYVAECFCNYDSMFGVYGKHSSIRWNTVSYTVTGDRILLTFVEDFSIDRYDMSKYSVFVLEKHMELTKDLKVLSVYDVQLSKSKK